MIDIRFILKENDFLNLNLYYFKSEGKLRRLTIRTGIAYVVLVLIVICFLVWKEENFAAVIAVVTAVVLLAFHARNMKKMYLKQFKKCTKKYENRFDKEVTLRLSPLQLHVVSVAGETNLHLNQIESVTETNDYFFIKLAVEGIVIPKNKLEKPDEVGFELKEMAKNLNIKFVDADNWKW